MRVKKLVFWMGIVLSLVGCSQVKYTPVDVTAETVVETVTETAEETTKVPDIVIEIETEPEPEIPVLEEGMVRSYLTGEPIDEAQGTRRPLAVMMSNDKESLPHYGINRAGIVYEAPVEGQMVRYMAIMEDYDDVERIGSVRSCRTYYTYFAREFDAIYAHYGQSTFAEPYLKNVDNINGTAGIGTTAFYRSSDKSAPHNAYTSFERIQESIEKLGYSQEYDEDYTGHFQFAELGERIELEGDDVIEAGIVTPGYVYHQPWFAYNEEDGLYYRYQYGAAHNGDEGQIAVTNVIIQYCPAGYYATTQYRNINVHESVYGYYITGGKAIEVSWEKDGEFGVTHFYDGDGNEIVLNSGKTWICVMTGDYIGKISITAKTE